MEEARIDAMEKRIDELENQLAAVMKVLIKERLMKAPRDKDEF